MVQVVFTPGGAQKCFLCGQEGHLAAECEGKPKRKRGEHDEKGEALPTKPFQVLPAVAPSRNGSGNFKLIRV